MRHIVFCIAMLISLMMVSTIHAASPNKQSPISPEVQQAAEEADTVRVVVALRQPSLQSEVRSQAMEIAQTQAAVIASVPSEEIAVIHQYRGVAGLAVEVTEEGLAALSQNPDVEAIDLDMPVLATSDNSTSFIGANEVWQSYGLNGRGVTVAVLDTGIDSTHADLADSIVVQQCFNHGTCPPNQTDQSTSAQDEQGHGTHVAGIITSNGLSAPLGVAPETKIVAVRVLNRSGSGWTSDVVKGIEWVTANRLYYNIKVINMSLGGGAFNDNCDNANANTMLYQQAIANAHHAGITLFAASGNEALANQIMAPACVTNVIAVGNSYTQATNQFNWPNCTDTNVQPDMVTCSSNSSPQLDVVAPGAGINSARLGGGAVVQSGTSMSTPHATGVAALLLQGNPNLTPDQIETILKESGTPVTDGRNNRTTPRIDALAAVSRVATPVNITTTMTGTILLQGRQSHGMVAIYLSTEPCETAFFGTPITMTAEDGSFEIGTPPTVASAGTGYQCLQVQHDHYLLGQKVNPQGNLGTLTLLTGDINGDNEIDILDLSVIARDYGSDSAATDLNADSRVDIFDLTLAAKNYKQVGPLTAWQ